MLLSLLCAFFVWLGVVNVADPIVTETVELPISIENDGVLTQNGLTYEIVGKKTATISYEVKTTNAYRIRQSDFRAYADLSEMWSVTGAVPVKVEVLNHADYLESNPVSRTSTIKIETEPLQRKAFDIAVKTNGSVGSEYQIGEITLSPDHLYLEGPESQVGQVTSAGIEFNLDGLTSDYEGTADVLYYDANGNRITLGDRVASDCEQVSYHVTVLKVKQVPVNFEVSGQVASGYRFTGLDPENQTVAVVGTEAALASLTSITVSGEDLDLTNARADKTVSVTLDSYLPDGVSIAGDASHEAQVTLKVERLEERNFTVEVNDASFVGERNGYIYRAVDAGTVTVRVRALGDDLDDLNITSSDLSIDVSGMGEGQHQATPEIELGEAYTVLGISSCTISVMPVPQATTEAATTRAEETEASTEDVPAAAEPSSQSAEVQGSSSSGGAAPVSGTTAQTQE